MLLKSLAQNELNFHRLSIENPAQLSSLSSARETYEALKSSGVYNEPSGRWALYVGGNWYHIFPQLLGILVEAEFDSKEARKNLAKLKDSAFLEKPLQTWPRVFGEAGLNAKKSFYVAEQLVGILVEATFDRAYAKTLHEKLKTSGAYDHSEEFWHCYVRDYSAPSITTKYNADLQLLGILVEAEFDHAHAQELYIRFKKSEAYDRAQKHWRHIKSKYYDPAIVEWHSFDQLLGVLAEAKFFPSNAPGLYDFLKNGPFFNKDLGYWVNYNGPIVPMDKTILAADQLLGIVVESRIGAIINEHFKVDPPALPEVKKF